MDKLHTKGRLVRLYIRKELAKDYSDYYELEWSMFNRRNESRVNAYAFPEHLPEWLCGVTKP